MFGYRHVNLMTYLKEGIVGILPICVKGIVPHAKQKKVDLILLSSEKHERCKMYFETHFLPKLDCGHMKNRVGR